MDSITLQQILQYIEDQISQGSFLQIITANSLMLLDTEIDAELQTIFEKSQLVIADSVGISLVAFLKGFPLAERIPGIDLMAHICQKAEEKRWPVYLIGAKQGVTEKVKQNLLITYPNLLILGTIHGYFNESEEKEILNDIQNKKPKILFVGLNAPSQEKWIFRNSGHFEGMCVMGVGGSFDVISGHLYRAPVWLRRCGGEWLFRLLQEPWRWKRIIRLPVFFYKAIIS